MFYIPPDYSDFVCVSSTLSIQEIEDEIDKLQKGHDEFFQLLRKSKEGSFKIDVDVDVLWLIACMTRLANLRKALAEKLVPSSSG